MKNRAPAWMIIAFASLFLVSSVTHGQEAASSPSPSDAIMRHIEELERQVKELRAEVATLKNQQTTESRKPVPVTAEAANFVEGSGSAPESQPAAPSSLAQLLGPTTLSGLVDVYYGQNFNHPASQTNSLRFFDKAANQFGLNLVELVVDKTPEAANSRTGYRLALGFGQAMNAVNGSDPGGLGFGQYLKEAYFSYLAPVGSGLQVDIGKFVTPHGAEVIETKDNWNYSRGLLFSYAIPYYHFGLRAKYALNDRYSVTGFLVNGWNNVLDNNTGKTYGISFGWTPNKKFGVVQNYMVGSEENSLNRNLRQLSDTTVTYSPTGKLSFMLNFDYGRGDRVTTDTVINTHPVFWTGVAGYVKYALNPNSAVSTRYEYYNDHDGFTTGTLVPSHFHEFTTTFEQILAQHIISRFEFRRDISNQPVFLSGSNPVMSQNTLTAGLVFTFSSREAK